MIWDKQKRGLCSTSTVNPTAGHKVYISKLERVCERKEKGEKNRRTAAGVVGEGRGATEKGEGKGKRGGGGILSEGKGKVSWEEKWGLRCRA